LGKAIGGKRNHNRTTCPWNKDGGGSAGNLGGSESTPVDVSDPEGTGLEEEDLKSIDLRQQSLQKYLADMLKDLKMNKIDADGTEFDKLSDVDKNGTLLFKDTAFEFLGGLEEDAKTLLHMIKTQTGSNILLVGRNGAGKSWILNLILLLTQCPPPMYRSQYSGSWKPGDETEQYIQNKLCPDEMLNYEDMKAANKIVRCFLKDDRSGARGGGASSESIKPEMIRPLERLCEGYDLATKECQFFFLPSREAGGSTTPCLIHLEHGAWSFLMYYKNVETIQSEAWHWVVMNKRAHAKGNHNDLYDGTLCEVNKARWDSSVSEAFKAKYQKPSDFLDLTQENEIQLHPDLIEVA